MMRLDEWRLRMSENVDKTLAKLAGASERTAAKFSKMQGKIEATAGRGAASIKGFFADAWKGAGDGASKINEELGDAVGKYLPGMGKSIAALSGPIAIALAGVVAIGASLMTAVNHAAAMEPPFRELRNLNLDKSNAELAALNERILDISELKGLDPTKVTQGIYDVQSTIGKFGPEVEKMVGDVGVASRALNMDFTGSVNGIAKALVQFKLPLTDVNKLMESNAKTVQVGVVTFDELSKVQTEYAGAASSASQKLDTANKVFALLTTNTKNADIAATMTKAAFQDLGKSDTIAGLKKIGVNVFDANGQMRQTDELLRELVPIFGKMSDQTFAGLKEEIGGSEGLRGLLDFTKASGQEVLRVLDTFDNTKFGLGNAIAKANNDLDVMNEKIDGKLKTAWTRLGQEVMPVWVTIKGMVGLVLEDIGKMVEAFTGGMQMVKSMLGFDGAQEKLQGKSMADAQEKLAPMREKLQAAGPEERQRMIADLYRGALKADADAKSAWTDTSEAMHRGISDAFKSLAEEAKLMGAAGVATATGDAVAGNGKTGDDFSKLFGDKKTGKEGSDGVSKGVTEIVGGGKSQRSVVVNIESLVKQFNVHTSTMKEGAQDVKRVVEETLISAVRGGELALSNE